jgi:hypothetical protein
MVRSLSLHYLALLFRARVFSLSLQLDFVLWGGGRKGVAGQPQSS